MIRNIMGQKFGKLTVVSYAGKTKYHMWNCLCECGATKQIIHASLIYNKTTSCGCVQREKTSKANKRHGFTINGKSRTYRIWLSMKGRCKSPSTKGAKYLIGKNIFVCDRWENNFELFLEDMGEVPSVTHSIDRIDNNKGYYKENCRWASRKEQNNNKTNNVKINSIYGDKTIAELSAIIGVPYMTLYCRIFRYNWSHDKALGLSVE